MKVAPIMESSVSASVAGVLVSVATAATAQTGSTTPTTYEALAGLRIEGGYALEQPFFDKSFELADFEVVE